MERGILAAFLLLTAGCAGPGADLWSQAGVGKDQFSIDDMACWRESQPNVTEWPDRRVSVELGKPYRKCMKKRGWRRIKW
jgi:hypothetical protein